MGASETGSVYSSSHVQEGKMNTMVYPIVRSDLVLPALESFWKFSSRDEHRVIVIDQSNAGLPDLVEAGLAHIHMRVYKNFGFAGAANRGIRLADTKYVTIANDDVFYFDERWWPAILEVFERVEDAVGVNASCPRITFGIKDVSRKNPRHIADIDSPEACLQEGAYDKLVKETPFRGLINGCAPWHVTFDKKKLLDNVGLFDERFYPGGSEDYDLMSRAGKVGLKLYVTHLSWIWHEWGASKDDKGHDGMPKICERPNWNHLGRIWEGKFDAWGRTGKRDPYVHVEPL